MNVAGGGSHVGSVYNNQEPLLQPWDPAGEAGAWIPASFTLSGNTITSPKPRKQNGRESLESGGQNQRCGSQL